MAQDKYPNSFFGRNVIAFREITTVVPGYTLASQRNQEKFWRTAVSRLVDGSTGVSGIFPSPQTQFDKIAIGLQDAVKRSPSVAGDFINIGNQAILECLEKKTEVTSDPRRIEALRTIAHTLQGIPGGLKDYGWAVPDLRPAHMYRYASAFKAPEQFIAQAFNNVNHPIYGVGKAANFQEVFSADYAGFLRFVREHGHAEIQFDIYENILAAANVFLVAHRNPTNLAITGRFTREGLETVRDNYAHTLANRCVGDSQAAINYHKSHIQQITNPVYGKNGEVDLSEVFNETNLAVQREIAEKSTLTQLQFLRASIDVLDESLRPDKDAMLYGRPDLRTAETQGNIALLTTSPIAKALKEREKKDAGRDTRTVMRAVQYLFGLVHGTPITDDANKDGTDATFALLGPEATQRKHLKQQMFELVASSIPRPPEHARLIHTIAGNNRLALMTDPTLANMASYDAAFTGAAEKMTFNLSQSEIELRALYDYLNLIQLTSPRTKAELMVLAGGASRLEKTTRYHPHRMTLANDAARNATQDRSKSPFYDAYMASGKMLLGLLPLVPPNQDLSTLLNKAFPEALVVTKIGDSDKFDAWNEGLLPSGEPNPDFKGPLYGFSDGAGRVDLDTRPVWTTTMEAKNRQLFNQMLGSKGRLSNPTFIQAEGTAQENFATAELYIAGMLLRETVGEEGGEEIKQEFRKQYIPLLINIITDAAKKERHRFSGSMHEMVKHVVHDLIPFFPMDAQKLFVDSLMDNTVWNDPALLENGGIISILLPLGWNKDKSRGFPSAPGEGKDGRRPIATEIVKQSILLMKNFPYVDGRSNRRFLILSSLGLNEENLKTMDATSLSNEIEKMWRSDSERKKIKGTVLFQLASLLGPLGTPSQQAEFARVVEDILIDDMLMLGPSVAQFPLAVAEFTNAAQGITTRSITTLNQVTTLVTDLVMKVLAESPVSIDNLADQYAGIPNNLMPLMEMVSKAAEKRLKNLTEGSQLETVEVRAKEIVESKGNTEPAVGAVLKLMPEHVSMEQVLAAFENFKPTVTSDSEAGSGASGTNAGHITLVAADRTPSEIAARLIETMQANNGANALAIIARGILNHEITLRQETYEYADATGAIETATMEEGLRQALYGMVTNVLTDQTERQKVILSLRRTIQEHEEESARQAEAVLHSLEDVQISGTGDLTTQHVNDLRTIVTSHTTIADKRRKAALYALQAAEQQITRLTEVAVGANNFQIEILTRNLEAQLNYLRELSNDSGKFAALVRAIQSILITTNIPITPTLPQPYVIFPSLRDQNDKNTPPQDVPLQIPPKTE